MDVCGYLSLELVLAVALYGPQQGLHQVQGAVAARGAQAVPMLQDQTFELQKKR